MFAFVTALLGLANGLMSYFNTKQLEEAGAAILNSKNLKRAIDASQKADAVIVAVDAGELSDPFLKH